MTGIDLGALDAFEVLSNGRGQGRPLEIAVARIRPDPEQPRKAFSQERLDRLADSIREAGVKVPVSLRPHPDLPEVFLLNHGERRWRAAQAAGLTVIPAFVEEGFTDYDQVIENLQREDLTPMELALFMDRKVHEGVKKSDIARKLGVHTADVTRHLALIQAPPILDSVYRSGRCTSPLTLYNLRALYDAAPRVVEAWIESGVEITRSSVDELKCHLTASDVAASFDHDQIFRPVGAGRPRVVRPAGSGQRRGTAAALPLLHVAIAGRSALVCLDRHPSSDATIFVQWVDTGAVDEVAAGDCRVVSLSLPLKAPSPSSSVSRPQRIVPPDPELPPEFAEQEG
ncbi:ParB/RepB/Spo0J family partition protein [Asticcacaulis sp. W401b]|uniref:ParB/RepB/Spo0J family partition protein n=1 Tax=Asticcacaulis sp. W401b TaxID=3388666 RepID=UPI0039708E5A